MKPAPFTYQRPDTLDQALAAYAAEPEAKILAGGQSLIPLMSMRLTTVPTLIDINGIRELSFIDVDSSGVRFGATARHSELLADPRLRHVQPVVPEALRHVAHPAIRNRGTTVGSLVHADASAEMPTILALTGGTLTVVSSAGSRRLSAEDLYVGPLETSLRTGEIATEAFVPALPARSGVAFQKIARRSGDFALCGVAAIVTHSRDGAIERVRAGYVSLSDVPTVLDLSEYFGAGQLDDAALEAAAEGALAHLEPGADIHGTAEYRAQLARTLTARVLRAADADARHRVEERVGA